MGPIAAGVEVLAGTAALIALAIGAIAGSVVWRYHRGVRIGLVVAAGLYLGAAAVALGLEWLPMAVPYGLPALLLTFFIAYVAATQLRAKSGLRALPIGCAALAIALAVGLLLLQAFRIGLDAPLWIASIADVLLLPMAWRSR